MLIFRLQKLIYYKYEGVGRMKYLLTTFAIITMLTSCDHGPRMTEDECRQNIDYSNELAGELACGAAAELREWFGLNFW